MTRFKISWIGYNKMSRMTRNQMRKRLEQIAHYNFKQSENKLLLEDMRNIRKDIAFLAKAISALEYYTGAGVTTIEEIEPSLLRSD